MPIIFFVLFLISCNSLQNKESVLLISFDGFRSDYIDWYPTPNIDNFIKNGVRSKGLIPVFVSKTFPNHFSIATGMYVENHGLIGNNFYDSKYDEFYSLKDRSKVEDPKFYDGEPIWVTAETQNIKTASYFWVGSEAPIKGTYPNKWKNYDHNFSFESRIDSIVKWFALPKNKRPRLSLLYFHEPDQTGHLNGPKSKETEEMVIYLDSLFGDLIKKLQNLDIYQNLNIIALSDHGMAEVNSKKIIDLSNYIDMTNINQEGSGPYTFLFNLPKNKITETITILKKIPNISAYLKKDIPDRYHFKNHYRIKDILVLADEGWYIYEKKININSSSNNSKVLKGTHGYDNQLQSMKALFIAKGPSFKNNITIDSFENINIYPLITHILNIKPNMKIDGNLKNINHILKQ